MSYSGLSGTGAVEADAYWGENAFWGGNAVTSDNNDDTGGNDANPDA